MTNIRFLLAAIIIIFSLSQCQNNIEQTKPVIQQVTSVTTPLSKKYFTEQELQFLKKMKAVYESGLCSKNIDRSIDQCYKMSAHAVKADLLNQLPIELNYPFNSDLSLEQFKEEEAILTIWNHDCSVMRGEEAVNYFCINNSGPAIVYFRELGKNSNTIRSMNQLFESGTGLNFNSLYSILLSMEDDLDFTNTDHQLFYTIMQLTLNEDLFQSIRKD